ncbi:MAG TPA: glycosyltransferase family 87 protein [Candidatus Dormibacteraeota bacterium]|nr:glycosyltransferase family 87 protein [Candidatus Dormibacteraeota bacterium]
MLIGVMLAAFNLMTFWQGRATWMISNDFRLPYAAALLGMHSGWSHLYDLSFQRAFFSQRGFAWSPFANPPPLAWLAIPFTALPFKSALVIWTCVLVAAVGLCGYLAAPSRGIARWAFWALGLGLFPIGFGVAIGQVVPLIFAAVAASWWLLKRGLHTYAGLCLSLLVLKPQLALLVPAALLVAGWWRTALVCSGAAGAMAAISAWQLGPTGIRYYLDALVAMSGSETFSRFALAGHFQGGLRLGLQVAVVLATCLIARRGRAPGPEIPIAAGLFGSILITPYTSGQDYTMLVLGAWLIVRAGPPPAVLMLLAMAYIPADIEGWVGPSVVILTELMVLASLFWVPRRDLLRPTPFPSAPGSAPPGPA